MELDSLYLLVNEGIERAERLEDLGAPGARTAHLDVSLIEEQIAALVPASEVEGGIARRGAVRHAVAAGDDERARTLMARYADESEIDENLRRELAELVAQADSAIARRYPRSAARFEVAEIRRVAMAFYRQGMPFPVPG